MALSCTAVLFSPEGCEGGVGILLEKLRKAAAANGRNPVLTVNRQTPLCDKARKRMAANCKNVNSHGKEGVSGSSPEESSAKASRRRFLVQIDLLGVDHAVDIEPLRAFMLPGQP
jgi:hypothetical protein